MVAQRGTIRRILVEQVGETQDAGWRPWQIDPRMPVVPLGAGGAVEIGEERRQLAGSEWSIDRTDLPEPMPARYRSASRILQLPAFLRILQQRGRGARGAAVPIWTTEEETYVLRIVNGKLVWSPLKHSLLDGNIHPDTIAGACQQGDIIIGGPGNKWTRLAKGNNGDVFTIVNGEPVWHAQQGTNLSLCNEISVEWHGTVSPDGTVLIDNQHEWRGRLIMAFMTQNTNMTQAGDDTRPPYNSAFYSSDYGLNTPDMYIIHQSTLWLYVGVDDNHGNLYLQNTSSSASYDVQVWVRASPQVSEE